MSIKTASLKSSDTPECSLKNTRRSGFSRYLGFRHTVSSGMSCRLRQLLLSMIFLSLPFTVPFARTFHRAGEFRLPAVQPDSTRDVYSCSFVNERYHGSGRLRLRIWFNDRFSTVSLKPFNVKIISSTSSTMFLECGTRQVGRICRLPGVIRCSVSRPVLPLLDSARHQSGADIVQGAAPSPLSGTYTAKGVLTGILDTEFDTRHPAFLDNTGTTRFIALWDQLDSTGAKSNRFGYGTIKNRQELLADSAFGCVAGNHGTHTASIMAGSFCSSGYTGAAPEAMIAAVHYGGTEEIIDGISWIFSLADSLKVPCVVNLSLGVASGPHDGTSIIDQGIDSLSKAGRIIVGAVGNDGAIPSHVSFTLNPKDTGRTWVLPQIDTLRGEDSVLADSVSAFSGIDLWGEPSNYFTVTLFILDRPTGRYLKGKGTVSTSRNSSTDVDSIVWNDSVIGTSKFYYIISVERSSRYNKKPHCTIYTRTLQPRLVCGIEIVNPSTSTTTVHGWNLTRKALNSLGIDGFTSGDSLFSVNEIGGTAHRIITTGGYIGRVELPLWNGQSYLHDWLTYGDAFYSSGIGPTVDGRTKPDICAPAWSVVAALSRKVPREYHDVVVWPDTSTTFGRYGGNTGTSMASPFVAGIVALMLQVKPDLTPEEARSILQETALHDSFTGPLATPDNKWGAGKVNALGAMMRLLDIPVSTPAPNSAKPVPRIIHCGNRLLFHDFPETCTFSLFSLSGQCLLRDMHIAGHSAALPQRVPAGSYIVRVYTASRSGFAPVNVLVVR